MRAGWALVAACLALLAAGRVAAQPAAEPSAAAIRGTPVAAARAGVAVQGHQAEVRRLQHAVAAQEAKRRETRLRLREQDRTIDSLRRQLQSAPTRPLVPSH